MHTEIRQPWLIFGGALLIAALTACGGSSDEDVAPADEFATAPPTTTAAAPPTTLPTLEATSTTSQAGPPSDTDGFRNQPVACGGELPPPPATLDFAAPDDLGIDSTARPRATIRTSCGDIVVELDPSIAPATVNSFVFLAEAGYFDGTATHRVVPGFVIQAGDPTATGIGRPGYLLPDEYPDEGFVYERGVVAMANAGPGTSGSQFFLMLDTAQLPPMFSVFGRVVAGFDVMDTIASVPLGVSAQGEQSVPLESVFIETVTVER